MHDTKLSDIVLADPTTVTVLNRFGITLGVGDMTVKRMADDRGLDAEFFATILNTYIHEDYFPERILATFDAATIVNYLSQTNGYYEQFQLPNIERHFQLLIGKSDPQNSNLGLMLKFFHEVKQELLARIDDDRHRWFPAILAREQGTQPADDSIEDKINDLLSMFVIHLKGDYDHNLALAVLMAVVSLKKDITQNNRIRNLILRLLSQTLHS